MHSQGGGFARACQGALPSRAEYLLQDATARGLGLPDALDALRRWQEAGGTHVCVVTMGRGFRTTEEHIAHLTEMRQRLAAA